jgi:shikimate kinase
MRNTIVYLVGFPGTGKYTIAKAICALTDARLVDNHLINNPVFSVIPTGGPSPLPQAVWGKTWAIRRVVLDVIRDISPPDFSFVFTNQLVEGDPVDARWFAEIVDLASQRHSTFIPVRLICEESELCRRVSTVDRKTRFKTTDPEKARNIARTHEVLQVKHHNALTLDVTALSASESAEAILQHADSALP